MLIIRACAIGDFVVNLPTLQALSRIAADVRFTLVGYPQYLELAKDFVHVAAIYSIEVEPWRRLFHDPLAGLEFDRAIVWMKDSVVAENLRLSGVGKVLWAPPFAESGHAAQHLLNTVGLPPPELPDRWRPESDRIILHPGSGSPKKCWPHFMELARRLNSVAFLIGPAETGFDTGRYPRLENLSLREVGSVLARSRAFVGNDSGITHLAAYLGCPTVALFGPTDPSVWGPIGRRIEILHFGQDELTVDEVARRVITAG